MSRRPGSTLELLTSLVDKSLLLSRTADDGSPRFTMLETIREFAFARLAELGRETETRRLHAHYFRDLAESVETELQGPSSRRSLQQLAVEHHNLRTALSWAADNDNETLLRLAAALWRFWYIRGHLTEGRTWLARALADHTQPRGAARARAARRIGDRRDRRRSRRSARGSPRSWSRRAARSATTRTSPSRSSFSRTSPRRSASRKLAVELYGEAATHARRAEARPALAGIMSNFGYLACSATTPRPPARRAARRRRCSRSSASARRRPAPG